jgi:hypothetical protein
MGECRYVFNPSEVYQRSGPGGGVETHCGAVTYPAVDEPELVPVQAADGTIDYRPSGRLLARVHDDPYCPGHGGTPDPGPVPVSMAELERAHEVYTELAARFQAQPGGALTAAVPEPWRSEQYQIGQGPGQQIGAPDGQQ